MPESIVGSVKSALSTTVRWGARRFPGVADAARRAYFDVSNRRSSQRAAYTEWVAAHRLRSGALAEHRLESREWPRQHYIGVVLDVCGYEEDDLERSLQGLAAQVYEHWELTVVADRRWTVSTSRFEGQRARMVVAEGSRADRLNAGLARSLGDFVVFVTPDDVVYPTSFYDLAEALSRTVTADVVYGGDDLAYVTQTRGGGWRTRRRAPFFKPDWNPELLRSCPYLGSVTLLRTSLVRRLGGLRDIDGGELWDLHLRATDAAATVASTTGIVGGRVAGSLVHVPDASARQVLESTAASEGRPDVVIAPADETDVWQLRYPVVGEPKVSIVIPSRNQLDVVRRCIESILLLTRYENYEIVLVDTGSDDPAVTAWYDEVAASDHRFRVVDWPEQPFSYARSCNAGADAAAGDVLVMLNNDTEVLDSDWLDVLVGEAQRPAVGAVGCLLLYPDAETIQHAGIGLGIKGVAGNSLAGLELGQWLSRTQRMMLHARRATTAVTAACLAVRADLYAAVGGFDEDLRITFNDVDLCCRIGALGFRNVYNPATRLLHHESISVSRLVAGKRDWDEFYAAVDLFKSRWPELLERDPQMNPNLSKGTTSYRLTFRGR